MFKELLYKMKKSKKNKPVEKSIETKPIEKYIKGENVSFQISGKIFSNDSEIIAVDEPNNRYVVEHEKGFKPTKQLIEQFDLDENKTYFFAETNDLTKK